MKPIRILLVDDHTLFRKGLAIMLEGEDAFAVVGEAQNGIEAVAEAKRCKPDVILMDISMPEADGITATREIRRTLPDTKIVMLTIMEEDARLFEAIKAGAHGYLIKNVRPRYLFDTVRGVVAGEAALSGMMAAKILGEFNRLKRSSDSNTHAKDELTDREIDVLKLLTLGMTNKAMAGSLEITENTIKNHLKHILEKLHLANRVQAAAYALERGIVPDDPGNNDS